MEDVKNEGSNPSGVAAVSAEDLLSFLRLSRDYAASRCTTSGALLNVNYWQGRRDALDEVFRCLGVTP